MKTTRYTSLFLVLLGMISFRVKGQDTLKVDRFKDIGLYVTAAFDDRYPELDFLKLRLISPTANIFDSHQGKDEDSTLDVVKYLSLVNELDLSNKNDDPRINVSYVEHMMMDQLTENITPLSIAFIKYYALKDSTIGLGYIDFVDNRFVDNSPPDFFPFQKQVLIAASPLNQVYYNNHVDFLLNDEYLLTNIPNDSIDSLHVNFDDGQGYRPLEKGVVYPVDYEGTGVKYIKVKIVMNGRPYITTSSIIIQDPMELRSSCTTPVKPPDSGPFNISTTKLGTFVSGKFAIWFSTCNSSRVIRKPFIISAGYNPGNGKQLTAGLINVNTISLNLGNQTINIPVSMSWNGEWRGTFYETYNGVYSKRFSVTEFNQCDAADNSNHLLDRLRDEGYDIIILSYDDGKDVTIDNAALYMELVEQINAQKFANGFFFENVACGFSAGAVTTRMALALMEARFKQGIGPHPHTKIWVSFEGEHQGANIPLGFQHFLRFQKDIFYTIPSLNALNLSADLINQLVANLAYNQVDTDNANEFHAYNASVAGNGPHAKRQNLLAQFSSIPMNNSGGYPEFVRRIGVSQGSGVGVNMPHTSNVLFHSFLGTNLSGTAVSIPSNCGGTYTWVGPQCTKTTTARYWSSNNNQNIFDGTVILNASFTWFPKTCVNTWLFGCQCTGPYTVNIPIQIKQTHIAEPTWLTSNFDDPPAATLTAHIELAKISAYPYYNTMLAGQANMSYDPLLHGFSPTVSCLDMKDPAQGYTQNNFLSPAGLNLLYCRPGTQTPNRRFGYPYINRPSDHYQITPFDAIFAIGDNNGTFVGGGAKPANQLHVEDPQEYIGDFLARVEVAPEDLYLSNRNLAATQSNYKAEFEARNKIIAGKNDETGVNSVYSKYGNLNYQTPDGNFTITASSKGIFHAGDQLEFLPGFEVHQGAEMDAFIQGYGCANLLHMATIDDSESNHLGEGYDLLPINNDNEKATTDGKSTWSIYPNPTEGLINIRNEESVDLSFILLNVHGEVMLNNRLKGEKQIDLKHLPPGIYLLQLVNTETNETKQFKVVKM